MKRLLRVAKALAVLISALIGMFLGIALSDYLSLGDKALGVSIGFFFGLWLGSFVLYWRRQYAVIAITTGIGGAIGSLLGVVLSDYLALFDEASGGFRGIGLGFLGGLAIGAVLVNRRRAQEGTQVPGESLDWRVVLHAQRRAGRAAFIGCMGMTAILFLFVACAAMGVFGSGSSGGH